MRNKILWLIVFCALVNFAFAITGKTNNNWKKVDENADGAWDDDSHWTLGMPGAAHYAYFPGGLGSYTVTFPKGDVEIETSFRANVNEGETLTFDGRGSNFRQGARDNRRNDDSRKPYARGGKPERKESNRKQGDFKPLRGGKRKDFNRN